MKTKENILVTGASGFIGSRLCERLIEEGFEVFGVSRSKQSEEDKIKWIQGNLLDQEFVENVIEDVRPDYVFHLASHVLGSRSFEFVISTMENNFLTSLYLMYALKKHGCKRLILAGSFEEGMNEGGKVVPSSPYAASKIASSNYARMFYKLYELPVAIASIYMVYGPGQQDLSKLIPYSILTALKGEKPRISSGVRMVDWIYIDDLVNGLVSMMTSPGIDGETVELGSGKVISVKDIVIKVTHMIDDELDPVIGGVEDRLLEQEDLANISMTKSQIGWSPQYNLEKGLRNTIEHYKKLKL